MDSWDDERFEVPTLLSQPVKSDTQWENEEDTLETENKIQVSAPTPASIEAARKKAELEEAALANHLKFSSLENETPEQRKLRERREVEEQETAIAGEMFGKPINTNVVSTSKISSSSSGTGLGGISLKTKQEHVNFAVLCSKKLADSTPLNISSYYKSVTDKIKDSITSEVIDEVIVILTKVREDKKKTEATQSKTVKKSKKQIAADNARHDDIFGGSTNDNDKYDHYTGLEDDFM